MQKQIGLIIIGAGDRGTAYADYAKKHPDLVKIVGIAEPRDHYRNKMADDFDIPRDKIFKCWKEVANESKFADGLIIATHDTLHTAPAVAFAEQKYNILLEKPMAPNEDDCRKIVETALKNKIIFGVCHVLRYTNYTKKLKEIIDSGRIGDVVNIQHFEPVGYWHYAHSFVRGNWGKESESSSTLLAKSCHDLDWIKYMIGCKCEKISSFGSLCYFKKDKKPPDAADRCLKCSIETQCPYSAKKIYLNRAKSGNFSWPVSVITSDLTEKGVIEALQKGPYGRCVWQCDNDVVDNQVVNMQFENGKTASFTMTAFTEASHRKTRIFGTKGQIEADGSIIKIFDFLTDRTETIDTNASAGSIAGGHGGGDYNIMKHFVEALAENDPAKILSGPAETLETHLMVFAAEKARKTNTIVKTNI